MSRWRRFFYERALEEVTLNMVRAPAKCGKRYINVTSRVETRLTPTTDHRRHSIIANISQGEAHVFK